MAVHGRASRTSIAPIIARSREAYRRELPELLKKHLGKWVAYSGDRRIGMGPSKTAVYQLCFRKGFKRGEFLVDVIEPEIPTSLEFRGRRGDRKKFEAALQSVPDVPPDAFDRLPSKSISKKTRSGNQTKKRK